MKKINISIALIVMGIFGCSDELEEINENPNSPVNVPADRLILGIERDMSRQYTINSFDLTNKFVHYTEFPNRLWEAFLVEREAEDDWWSAHFGEIRNVNHILQNISAGEEDYRGVALVMRSWMYYLLSAYYGDVPYTTGGLATENINQPTFDNQEAVFAGILADLEEANQLLGTGSIPLINDFLLDNDVMKWKKFANSLRVRVLMARSGQIDPSAALQSMLDDPTTYPMMSSNSDQPAFTYDDVIQYPRNRQGEFFTLNTFMAEDFINTLTTLNDERIKAFSGQTSGGDYVGVVSGSADQPVDGTVSPISDLILDAHTIFTLQTVWMSYAELQFLWAEAAERGWIQGGTTTAETYYNQGIEASYAYQASRVMLGIEQGLGLTPMANFDPGYLEAPGVDYTGSTDEKLALIATQKWIALFNDMESYFSWRRTGLPSLTVNPAGPNGGVYPMRFRYPLNERVFNTANYEVASAAMGGDEWNTLMWILK